MLNSEIVNKYKETKNMINVIRDLDEEFNSNVETVNTLNDSMNEVLEDDSLSEEMIGKIFDSVKKQDQEILVDTSIKTDIDRIETELDEEYSKHIKNKSKEEILEQLKLKYHLDIIQERIDKGEEPLEEILKVKNSIEDSVLLERLKNKELYKGYTKEKYNNLRHKVITKVTKSKLNFPALNYNTAIINVLAEGEEFTEDKMNLLMKSSTCIKKFLYGYYKFIEKNNLIDEYIFIYFFSLSLKNITITGLDEDRKTLQTNLIDIMCNYI